MRKALWDKSGGERLSRVPERGPVPGLERFVPTLETVSREHRWRRRAGQVSDVHHALSVEERDDRAVGDSGDAIEVGYAFTHPIAEH